jgi:hypothetical protein
MSISRSSGSLRTSFQRPRGLRLFVDLELPSKDISLKETFESVTRGLQGREMNKGVWMPKGK